MAFGEPFTQTLQQECLDYFLEFGERHMDHLVSEMLAYYHEERPHQAKGNDPLAPATSPGKATRKEVKSPHDVVPISQIASGERLGGLLKHYYRRAV